MPVEGNQSQAHLGGSYREGQGEFKKEPSESQITRMLKRKREFLRIRGWFTVFKS
jgi:hypothetical protein